MEDSCNDCAYTTCAQLHSYVAHECKLSDGNPCQECVQLAKLDSQISEVHSQLVQLARKRHALKTKINQRHEPFIHRLPLEVSSQIFAEYVHQAHDTFDPKEASDSEYTSDWSPALFLSSICATWRKIALATPEIWRFINIPLLEYDPDVDLKIKLLNELVDRTGQRTLFIGVFQFQLDEEPRFSQLEEKLNTLVPLFNAVKKVACRSEEITLWGLPTYALQLIIPRDTANLTTVRIAEAFRLFPDGDGPVGWNSGDIFLAGPLLRNLDFGSETSSLLDFTEIKWGTITNVTMSAIDVKEGIDILRRASCLTSCSFVFYEGYNIDPVNPPVVNSTLEQLRIEFSNSGGDFVTFANSVTLPSLRGLCLQTSTLPNLKPLFERSQCQIQKLALTLDQNIPENDVLKLLNILPSVENFALEISNAIRKPVITNKFFERLRGPSSGSAKPILPKLTSLSYTGSMHFTWPTFLEMFPPPGDVVHAAGRPLSEVSLKLHLPKGVIGDLGVTARLRKIRQSNINLVVTNLEGKDLL